jgi:hypothetical protein
VPISLSRLVRAEAPRTDAGAGVACVAHGRKIQDRRKKKRQECYGLIVAPPIINRLVCGWANEGGQDGLSLQEGGKLVVKVVEGLKTVDHVSRAMGNRTEE